MTREEKFRLSDDGFKKWYDEEAVPNIELLSTYSTAEFARAAWAEAIKRAMEIIERLQDELRNDEQ